ncbi:hypothetical protein [Streptomyces sp. NPDC006739]|uniref:hypothetical protein n=1 Tax=Streptomyces sp. NPDC006739 TaxID=3364763 RepID=UPI0036AE5EBF
MANLPVPVPASEVPGAFITSALWNANVYNGLTYLLNPPVFFGYQTSGQSLTSGTGIAVTLDTETIDTYGGHSTTTNTSRYTAQVAGTYLVSGGASVNGATSQTYLAAYICKNGVEQPGSRGMVPGNSSHTYTVSAITISVVLAVGDYVEIFVQADGTSPTTHGSATQTSSMSVTWIHA